MKIEYMASHYRKQKEGVPGETSLLLQQASREDNGICLALVYGESPVEAEQTKEGRAADGDKIFRSQKYAVRRARAEEMLCWMYKRALPRCGKAGLWSFRQSCSELGILLQRFREEEGIFVLTGMFCVNDRFLLFSKGRQRTCHINTRFLKPNLKELSGETQELQVQTGILEPEVGILLGTEPFFEGLSEEMIQTCLSQGDLHTKLQTDRHLRELGEAGAFQGNKAAILICAKEAGKGRREKCRGV